MKSISALLSISLLLAAFAGAQNQPAPPSNNPQTPSGWRGFLSIDYKGGRFIMPYTKITSISRHNFIVDGGGKVHELTVDTNGSVIARYYFLESLLENNPLNSVQILNNRMKSTTALAEKRTGEDARTVVKHYPNTTHAKTVEFNVSSMEDLERVFGFIVRKWIDEGGRGSAETLRIQ